MLEVPSALVTDTALERWRARVQQMVQRLGWPVGSIVARCHATGATLAFEAPMRCLLTATEVNEWAWLGALSPDDRWPAQLGPANPADEVDAAVPLLRQLAQAEAPPPLDALLAERATREVPLMVDDEAVTIGAGARSRT
ncbi:MAG: hypothetical protein P3B98_07620 [Gemmatimonadota bacterium]|nr:hypothetical protein [Gemmatimonadota bacterium]